MLHVAAKLVSLTYSAVYKARRVYPELDKAIDEIKAEQDSPAHAKLEDISLTQAVKPGNVTERIFRMKAYDPKYRDLRIIPGPSNISIIFGLRIPESPGRNIPLNVKVTDAGVEEGEGPKTIGKGNGKMSILSDDEVEIDV